MSAGLKLGAASLGLLAIGAFASGNVPNFRSLPSLFSSAPLKSEVAEAGVKKAEKRVEKEASSEKIVQQQETSNLVQENIEPVTVQQLSEPTPVASLVKEQEITTYQAPVTIEETKKETATPKTVTKQIIEEAKLFGEGKKESEKLGSKGKGDGGFCSNLLGIWRVRSHTECNTETNRHYR